MTPARPGRFTCSEHDAEEAAIQRTLDELARVEREIQAYETTENKHPDEAKALETAVHWFFNQVLTDHGSTCSGGFRARDERKNEQLDVVASVDPDGFSAVSQLHRATHERQLALHFEIAYRTRFGSESVEKAVDLALRLDRTIQHHVERGWGIPFCGVILLGPAWAANAETTLSAIRKIYLERPPKRVETGGTTHWPFLDAIVLPGGFYKKHDLFETETLEGRRWPVLMGMPLSLEPLRPLAVARGFLPHRLAVLRGESAPETNAWDDRESSAIFGPELPRPPGPPTMCLWEIEHDRRELWHQGSRPGTAPRETVPVRLLREGDTPFLRPGRTRR